MAIKPKIFKKLTEALAAKVAAGRYEVAFARSKSEIEESQSLRYRVLFKEGKGNVTPEMEATGREIDQWDEIAYHVIVTDTKLNKVVGSIRLVSKDMLLENQRSYTEKYFDLSKLWANYKKPLELSRACIEPGGRDGVVLLLMWKFTMQFINDTGFDVLFGCASFSSTKYKKHAPILHFLHENNLAPQKLMPQPIVESHIRINDIEFDSSDETNKEQYGKRMKVPTMLRGYLKLGAKVSDTAIIDPEFNTTFLCIYVDAKNMQSSDHVLTKG